MPRAALPYHFWYPTPMNWNPVVNALVEELLGAVEQLGRAKETSAQHKKRMQNIARGRINAVWRVAASLGLTEHHKRELDYLLDEPEKELAGL